MSFMVNRILLTQAAAASRSGASLGIADAVSSINRESIRLANQCTASVSGWSDRPVRPPRSMGRVPQPVQKMGRFLRAGPAIRCMQWVLLAGSRLSHLLLRTQGLCDSETLKLMPGISLK